MDSPLHASVSSLMLILVLQGQRAIDTLKKDKLGGFFSSFQVRSGSEFIKLISPLSKGKVLKKVGNFPQLGDPSQGGKV